MKKKIISRSMLGFPLGLSVGYLMSIILSLIWANGYYAPCVPELSAALGSELNAVILQAFLSGILGSGFGAASVIWEMDNWGILKQSGIYFLLVSLLMMPIAYITHWMEHSLKGMLIYFGIFFVIFAAIWIIQYLISQQSIKKINAVLRNNQSDRKNEDSGL